jgi:endogenous inhibitor of DNA gyrase (YacG/DUF329 family)
LPTSYLVERITLYCTVCHAAIYIREAELKRPGRGRFCSRSCSAKWRRTHKLCGKKHSGWLHRTCQYCGTPIKVSNADAVKGEGKFCSRSCLGKWRAKNDPVISKTLSREGAKAKWNNPELRKRMLEARAIVSADPVFRAKQSEITRKLNRVGPKSSTWKGGKSFEPYCPKFTKELKEAVREAFNRKCYLCGKPETERKLDIHHCDYNKSQGCSGNLWSLLPLCRSCHVRTNNSRWHWFALLRDYWIYEHIDFNSNPF